MQTLRSPLFIVCLFLFIMHQVLQKLLHIYNFWIDSYLDNFLAMPIILSLWQFEKICLFRKGRSYKLSILEITVATIYISFITEIVFPMFSKEFEGDILDLLVYTLGSGVFFTYNNFSKKINKPMYQ